jgi:hypothetical protein
MTWLEVGKMSGEQLTALKEQLVGLTPQQRLELARFLAGLAPQRRAGLFLF